MSGWIMTSSPTMPAMIPNGTTTSLIVHRRRPLRTQMSAPTRTRASFASSEGWNRIGPNDSHRLDPPAVVPNAGWSTSMSPTSAASIMKYDKLRQRR